jgi:hypothetical protein
VRFCSRYSLIHPASLYLLCILYQVVHKALEKEIHPVEVKLSTTTREDAWGVRFLNMLASLEALIGLGTCRELPVVGFVRGIMVVGVIVSCLSFCGGVEEGGELVGA